MYNGNRIYLTLLCKLYSTYYIIDTNISQRFVLLLYQLFNQSNLTGGGANEILWELS